MIYLTKEEFTTIHNALRMLYEHANWMGTPPGYTCSDFRNIFDAGERALDIMKELARLEEQENKHA